MISTCYENGQVTCSNFSRLDRPIFVICKTVPFDALFHFRGLFRAFEEPADVPDRELRRLRSCKESPIRRSILPVLLKALQGLARRPSSLSLSAIMRRNFRENRWKSHTGECKPVGSRFSFSFWSQVQSVPFGRLRRSIVSRVRGRWKRAKGGD